METTIDRRTRSLARILPALALALAAGVAACADGDAPPAGNADAAEAADVAGDAGGGAAGSGEDALETWAPGPPLARPPGSGGPPASRGGAPGAPSSGNPLSGDAPAGESRAVDLSRLGYDFGDPDAPVRIVEFSDFGCGYCRQFHLETYPTLHEEYVETGKVHWKYVPYILGMFGPNAVDAALAGECAGEQDRFVPMRERLFASQSEWKGTGDPRAHFRRYAREEGLDVGRFDGCMEELRPQERVVASSRLGRQLGIRGTPTFFILGNSVIPGALPLETFRMVLDQLLAEAEAAQGGTGGG